MDEAHSARRRARTSDEQIIAEDRYREAERQRNLMLQIGVTSEEGDFYPYRYPASEGFLPGYNFPSLPIRAWIPRKRGEFIPRSRVIALREYAPGNLIYHEGAKFEVTGFTAPPGGLQKRRMRKRPCNNCGAFADVGLDPCPYCEIRFDGANSSILKLLEMPNVRTQKRPRITCDEEDRIRRWFAVTTHFKFPTEGRELRRTEADVVLKGSTLLRLVYGPASTVLRINHGAKAEGARGFLIDFETGGEVSKAPSKKRVRTPQPDQIDNVQLAVQTTQNLLLVSFASPEWKRNRKLQISIQYALQRGIEQAFQLEESEIGSETVGEDSKSILFYEVN